MPRGEMGQLAPPLLQILHAHGIRRVQLAAVSGVSEKTIGKLCRGEYLTTRIETLCRVASALGVAPVELFPRLGMKTRTAAFRRNGMRTRESNPRPYQQI